MPSIFFCWWRTRGPQQHAFLGASPSRALSDIVEHVHYCHSTCLIRAIGHAYTVVIIHACILAIEQARTLARLLNCSEHVHFR